MAKVCMVTGKKPMSGNNVSHANNKTRRRFEPNLQDKRFWVPSEKRWVKLRVSAKAIKIISKRGIERVLADLRKEGLKSDRCSASLQPVSFRFPLQLSARYCRGARRTGLSRPAAETAWLTRLGRTRPPAVRIWRAALWVEPGLKE